MVGTLRDVWRVHSAREEGGPPRWRSGAELPPVGKRLQSPYDPEVHYSTRRQLKWSGYKVHVTEACDANAAHLITHVMTCPAMQSDMASMVAIHQKLADKGLLPAEHFMDAGYVDADLLVASQRDILSRWRDRCAPCQRGQRKRNKPTSSGTLRSNGRASGSSALRVSVRRQRS